VTRCNPAAVRLFGYTAEEMAGLAVARLIPARNGISLFDQLSADLAVPPFETHGARRDGGQRDIWVTASALRGASGAVTGGLVVVRDHAQHDHVSRSVLDTAERYNQLAEITREAWWEEDLVTGAVRNSQRFCQMLGLDDSMLNYPLSDYVERIHPDDRERVMDSFHEAVRTDRDYLAVYRVRHSDGHYIWIENRSRVITRDEHGNPALVLGAMTDVTTRVEAEQALRASEERYRLVAEITEEAWWEEDVQAAILTNSHRFCDITGRGEEILNCTVEEYRALIHPDDVIKTRAGHDRAVKEGTNYRQVYRLRHADGHYVFVEDWARVVARDAQGRPTRMLGSLIDVTARQQAEIALQESEENFRRLFDDAPDAYLIVDPADGRILACNQAAARMLRGSREQIVGRRPGDMSPPFQPDGTRSTDATLAKVREIMEKGHLRFEWMHRRLDGTDFWAEVVTAVGTFRQHPAIFTSWREIGEIIAAKQAAEAASVAKSQFLSVVSHELRTPLSAIMGMFQLIQLTSPNDKVRDYTARGLRSSDHLLKLVEDILDFSNIEAGRLAVVPTPFHLKSLIDDVVQAAETGRKPGVDLKVTVEETLRAEEFVGDALRLRQVLLNLLGNALKFTASGSVVLSVSRAGGTPDKPLIEFSVADTGIGLSPDQQSRLFKPFTQADMSNARRYGGTGLGLVISQRLVTMLGGEPITVESRADVGSRFAFRLPLPAAGPSAREEQGLVTNLAPGRPARLDGRRILVVEDSQATRFTLSLLLKAEGAIVAEAENGAEGVRNALVADPPYDMVLMDMQMPVMDGLSATRELRARGYARPIVALTANAFSRDRDACLAAGMNGYIAKPVKIDNLVDAVERHYRA
jgi:PAS domain S-box-containing protein